MIVAALLAKMNQRRTNVLGAQTLDDAIEDLQLLTSVLAFDALCMGKMREYTFDFKSGQFFDFANPCIAFRGH